MATTWNTPMHEYGKQVRKKTSSLLKKEKWVIGRQTERKMERRWKRKQFSWIFHDEKGPHHPSLTAIKNVMNYDVACSHRYCIEICMDGYVRSVSFCSEMLHNIQFFIRIVMTAVNESKTVCRLIFAFNCMLSYYWHHSSFLNLKYLRKTNQTVTFSY